MAGTFEAIRALFQSEKPVRWVFAGDSITHGAAHTWGRRDYTELFSERVRFEMGRYRDHVIKVAVAGYSAQSVWDDIEWNILQFHPEVLFVMLGMNDCGAREEKVSWFTDNYQYIVDRVRGAGTEHIVVCTSTPIRPEAGSEDRPALPAYVEATRAFAERNHLPLVDHYADWIDGLKRPESRVSDWYGNAVHPNAFGHMAMARPLMTALGIWAPANSAISRMFIP